MSINIIPEIKTLGADAKYLNEKDLVIGINDKSIGVVQSGILIELLKIATYNRIGESNGSLLIPCKGDINFKIVWGLTTVTADTTTTISFADSFNVECHGVFPVQSLNDPVTGIMASVLSKSQFSLTIVGGSSSEKISYFAIGV